MTYRPADAVSHCRLAWAVGGPKGGAGVLPQRPAMPGHRPAHWLADPPAPRSQAVAARIEPVAGVGSEGHRTARVVPIDGPFLRKFAHARLASPP